MVEPMFRTLLILVLLAPLPLGSVYAWSWAVMALVVGGLMGAWSLGVLTGRCLPAVGLRATWPAVLLFALVAGWAVAQTLPVMPGSWHHPIWAAAAEALGRAMPATITIDADAAIAALTRLLTYAGVFWLSLQLCRDRHRARAAIAAVAYAGAAYAAYGLFVEATGSGTILWFPKVTHPDDLSSTFVNRNSFAAYAGLALICATGLIIDRLSHAFAGAVSAGQRVGQAIEAIAVRGMPLLLSWVVILSALLLTRSRGGFLAAAVALPALFLAFGRARAVDRRLVAGSFTACGAALVLVFSIGGDVLDARLARTLGADEERLRLFAATLDAIAEEPGFGTGYGTFEDVFARHRPADFGSRHSKAHNTYLENVLELGLPAALALFAIFAGVLVVTFRGAGRRRRDVAFPCIGFAATVLVAAHALIDFGLQIPAIAATWCLIAGAACAQSAPSRAIGGAPTDATRAPAPGRSGDRTRRSPPAARAAPP
jgi:O-antigen ligase